MLALQQETGACPIAEDARLVQRRLPRTAIDRLDSLICGNDVIHQTFHGSVFRFF